MTTPPNPTDPAETPQTPPAAYAPPPAYSQPGAAPAPYAQPGAAVAPPVQPGAPATSIRNPAGTISLAMGVALLAWQFAFLFIQATVYAGTDIGLITSMAAINLSITGLLAIGGLIVGLIGLARRDRPRVTAGIGVGLAIAGLTTLVIGLLYPLVMTLVYSA